MTPSFPIPTDNIYKFACLFGLTLIVASIFSYVSTYTASLDRKVKYTEVIIPLEAKEERSAAEKELLGLNKKLVQVTKSNEDTAATVISAVFGLGIALSAYGAYQWHDKIQKRDDQIAKLQIEKLEAEIKKLQNDLVAPTSEPTESSGIGL